MINREVALNTLRLPIDANRADIISAYGRLARRYPLQQFPERHSQLLEAKSLLLNPELAFQEILTEDVLDISWLNQYSHLPQSENNVNVVDTNSAMKNCLQALLRPHLLKKAALFEDKLDIGFDADIDQILDELGHDGLRKLIDEFGIR